MSYKLKSPTLRERFPGAFPPLPIPINEDTIKAAAFRLRKEVAGFIRYHCGGKPTQDDLFTLLRQVIATTWGPLENLPSDEYQYLFSRILSEYRKPIQLTLRLGSLRKRDILTIKEGSW